MKTRFHVFFLFSLIFTLAMTANARQVSLQTDSETGVKYINMPEWDFDTLNLTAATSFTVYDDGGENGNYSNNVNGYLVLIAPEGLSFAVSGTLNTESCCDALAIYKGDINNDEYLLNGRGEGFEIGHSYFCGQTDITDAWLHQVVNYDIIPMLQEYWFDNKREVENWRSKLNEIFND